MFYSKKISGLVDGGSMNVDEGVETVSSLKPNPKKPKKKTLPDRKRLRSLRPRLSASSNSSNERIQSLRPRLSSSSNSTSAEMAYAIG